MISFEEHIGPCQDNHASITCQCGRPSRAVQITKFINILSFTLFIADQKLAYRCLSCSRIKATKQKISGLSGGLSTLAFGWCQIGFIVGMLFLGYRFAYPDDKQLRESPKVGDILVVNLYQITGEAKDQPHPFTLAKVINVDEDTLQLQISRWQYLREFATFKDMLSRQDLMASYFSNRDIKVSQIILDEDLAVRSIRRRHSHFDVDEIHQKLFFQTKINQAPSIN